MGNFKAKLGGFKKWLFLGVFISETQKLHLQMIELSIHSFSEHVLVRLLLNFNAENIYT